MKNIRSSIEKKKFDLNNVTVNKGKRTNVNVSDDIIQALKDSWETTGDKNKAIAETVMSIIGDSPDNLNFHIKIAKYIPADQLIECAKISVEAGRCGLIRSSVPKYFVGVLKRKNFL